MNEVLLAREPIIRSSIFIGVLVAMVAWEWVAPRRSLAVRRWRRWPSNLGIVVLNTVAVRLLFPTTAVALAIQGEQQGWGLLNRLGWPAWVSVVIAIVVLDLAIYLQHVMVHAVPALWRLHRMHHADIEFDVTTGSRFHPMEILLSLGIKLMVISALGAPAVAVLVFEVLLNAISMFNHSNVRIPMQVDRLLRWLVVTPDMHRVHHSVIPQETNSNFGFNSPWWDWLFGTYRSQPMSGHEVMTIGTAEFRQPKYLRLDWLLFQPFLGSTRDIPINAEHSQPSSTTGELH